MLKKVVNFSEPLVLENFENQISLELNATKDNISSQLMLSFVLLKEELAEIIEFSIGGISIFLKINKGNHSLCSFYNLQEKVFRFSISINELEFCLFYLLKYYRDGVADVSHVDLDFKFSDEMTLTWTIEIDSFKQQSIEEIHKILNI